MSDCKVFLGKNVDILAESNYLRNEQQNNRKKFPFPFSHFSKMLEYGNETDFQFSQSTQRFSITQARSILWLMTHNREVDGSISAGSVGIYLSPGPTDCAKHVIQGSQAGYAG